MGDEGWREHFGGVERCCIVLLNQKSVQDGWKECIKVQEMMGCVVWVRLRLPSMRGTVVNTAWFESEIIAATCWLPFLIFLSNLGKRKKMINKRLLLNGLLCCMIDRSHYRVRRAIALSSGSVDKRRPPPSLRAGTVCILSSTLPGPIDLACLFIFAGECSHQ